MYKCIKSLFKSTYKKNAFSKNKKYEIVGEDDRFIFLKDNEGNSFNFSKNNDSNVYYKLDDYMVKSK
jgi:hypothetical protein